MVRRTAGARAYEALRESKKPPLRHLEQHLGRGLPRYAPVRSLSSVPNVDVIFGYAPDEVQAMGGMSHSRPGPVPTVPASNPGGRSATSSANITSKTGQRRTILVHFEAGFDSERDRALYARYGIAAGRKTARCGADRSCARGRLRARWRLTVFRHARDSVTAHGDPCQRGRRPPLHEGWLKLNQIFDEIERAAADAAQIIERQRTLVLGKRPLERSPST